MVSPSQVYLFSAVVDDIIRTVGMNNNLHQNKVWQNLLTASTLRPQQRFTDMCSVLSVTAPVLELVRKVHDIPDPFTNRIRFADREMVAN